MRDHITIAIRESQFDTPRMEQFFGDLAEHVPPRNLSDTFHGIKSTGHIMGGNWVDYENAQGHQFKVNNFSRAELETVRYTRTYIVSTDPGTGMETAELESSVAHGKPIDLARLDVVRSGADHGNLKMSINQNPSAQLAAWGLTRVTIE